MSNNTFCGPDGEVIKFISNTYSNGMPHIQLMADGAPYATLTILPIDLAKAKHLICPGEFTVKVWDENEEVAACALKSGLFEDTGKRVPCGPYVEAHVWRITP